MKTRQWSTVKVNGRMVKNIIKKLKAAELSNIIAKMQKISSKVGHALVFITMRYCIEVSHPMTVVATVIRVKEMHQEVKPQKRRS